MANKKTGATIGIVLGSVALIALGIYIVPKVISRMRARKGEADPQSNYEMAKRELGPSAKVFSDHTTLTTTQKKLGVNLGFPTAEVRVKIWPDGFVSTFYRPSPSQNFQFIFRGKFYRGGQEIRVGSGKNAGKVFKAQNFKKNIAQIILT